MISMIRSFLTTSVECHSILSSSGFFHQNISTNRAHFYNDSKLDNLNFLAEFTPGFCVNAANVKVIHHPKDFYNILLKRASAAKERIGLASLYIGVGKLESELIEAIRTNLNSNKNIKVNVLLDFTRGTRGKINSKTMLMPLLNQSENFNLSLYHTPLLRGITKSLAPARWNEVLGLQHMKIYLFDDSIIMSGANLSNDYFTNRQDRYIEIQDKKLTSYFSSLLEKVQEFSLKVERNGSFSLHENWNLLPYKSDQQKFATEAKARISSFFKETFEKQRHELDNISNDTWIFPTLEMGQLGIHHDSVVMEKILNVSEKGSTINMASGYFNLTEKLKDFIVKKCHADFNIIMAHPNANGFKGSSWPSSGIPDAYTLIAKKFFNLIKENEQENRISLFEYERSFWTYHAKGIWYYPVDSSLPCMTVVGSSNYGERSLNRDLESQICLVTTNKELQLSLKNEYDHLKAYASPAEFNLLQRIVPNWVKCVVLLFKNFF
ncbi:CLUMA_CG005437, isoform A [Clunio marinus]|uniref:CDP-diacylglycerol--glycerol-3-phosphate 3-phosphatidyltransferase n=1 Tax=Clunio marinus TaxID=568069 RepID=A0A1J1HWS8_9DIPT|nr:CLUMA_CG005437, isoform A [Clunio marinus]